MAPQYDDQFTQCKGKFLSLRELMKEGSSEGYKIIKEVAETKKCDEWMISFKNPREQFLSKIDRPLRERLLKKGIPSDEDKILAKSKYQEYLGVLPENLYNEISNFTPLHTKI